VSYAPGSQGSPVSHVPESWDTPVSYTPGSQKIWSAENPKWSYVPGSCNSPVSYVPGSWDSRVSYVPGSRFLFPWSFKPMQQPLKKHPLKKNSIIVALTIKMHIIHVSKFFLAQEFLINSPVSQAPLSLLKVQ